MSEWEGLIRISVAAILGAAIGFERGFRGKEAGIRTIMLVAIGASTFMVTGILLSLEGDLSVGNITLDPTRVMGETISGIGFLGGAIVFRRGDRAEGVTTAATIWAATAIGLASGTGHFILAIGGTVLIIVTLYGMRLLESQAGLKDRMAHLSED